MAFPDPKRHPLMSFELLIALLATLLLLLSLWITSQVQRSPHRSLLAVMPIAQPAMAQEKISIATPTALRLTATIHPCDFPGAGFS